MHTVLQYGMTKKALPGQRFYCPIRIAVFPYVVTWNRRSYTFLTPAIFGLIDSSEASLILEHKANLAGTVENFGQFVDSSVNFYEVSMTSPSAFLRTCFSA